MENELFPLVFGILALSFVFINYESSIRIITFLKEKGVKFNSAFMHINIFKNAHNFKQLKIEEKGRAGREYFAFYITFIIFTLFAGLTIISFIRLVS